jgi:UDP-hydrolysing UDP-N-acetyl-D-glucosamine 2-epimerase
VADEAMRHAITKLAHLHFAATPRSRSRLIRMGEPRALVFDVGSPAADDLRRVQAADDGPRLIVAQHPIGRTDRQEQLWMNQTLRAVGGGRGGGRRRRARHDDVMVISPNDDAGSAGIRAAIDAAGIQPVEHLPRERFVELLAGAQAIVGNSSAGLIEAAILKTACVNVGPRQAGREKCANVVDCDYGKAHVAAALDRALALDLGRLRHPYGGGRTGQRIARTLATIDLASVPVRKRNSY